MYGAAISRISIAGFNCLATPETKMIDNIIHIGAGLEITSKDSYNFYVHH